MSRSYEDYEELGHYLAATDEALSGVQRKLGYMFPLEDEDRRELHSKYGEYALMARVALDELCAAVAIELDADVGGLEVPLGKPRKPSPFDRETAV